VTAADDDTVSNVTSKEDGSSLVMVYDSRTSALVCVTAADDDTLSYVERRRFWVGHGYMTAEHICSGRGDSR
jgi:hypothetical protein